MTLSVCHRATCDAPKCRASEMLPHASTKYCRTQLSALGWSMVRWRIPRSGMKHTRYGDYVEVADTGGPGRILYLCPKHGQWRPAQGAEHALPRIP